MDWITIGYILYTVIALLIFILSVANKDAVLSVSYVVGALLVAMAWPIVFPCVTFVTILYYTRDKL